MQDTTIRGRIFGQYLSGSETPDPDLEAQSVTERGVLFEVAARSRMI